MQTLLRAFALILPLLTAATAAGQAPSSDRTAAEEDLQTIYNFVGISDRLATAGQPAYDQIVSIRQAGFDVDINLAVANESTNALEGYLATEEGMTYVQIPVDFGEPSLRDLELFFEVMKANADRRVFVHCAANMRASAFTYLYRTLVEGVDEDTAIAAMEPLWNPHDSPGWHRLFEEATAKYGR